MKSTANKISNVDIAVYALYLLGGVGRKVHLEEIAVKCHKMAAGRFAFELSRYNEHPDKHAVFCALADARKPQIGGLIEGTGARSTGGDSKGKYQITEPGVKWIKDNETRIIRELNITSSVEPKREMERIRRNLRALKNEVAFKQFQAGEMSEISVYGLADFLGCSFETSPSAVRKKFGEMKTKVALVEDAEISAFLHACEGRFAKLLHTNEEAQA